MPQVSRDPLECHYQATQERPAMPQVSRDPLECRMGQWDPAHQQQRYRDRQLRGHDRQHRGRRRRHHRQCRSLRAILQMKSSAGYG